MSTLPALAAMVLAAGCGNGDPSDRDVPEVSDVPDAPDESAVEGDAPPGDDGAPDADAGEGGATEPVLLETPDGARHYYAGSTAAARGFVFLPGSSGETSSYLEIARAVASLGDVLVLVLDYCNDRSVGTICQTYCGEHPELDGCECLDTCFDVVRRVRVDGPSTAPIAAAAAACAEGAQIVARLQAALELLGAASLLDCSTTPCGIAWSRLVLAGSSQGAGMAAYLGVDHGVRRVNQYSGTVDSVACIGQSARPAAWIARVADGGATPPEDYYGLLHTGDSLAGDIERAYEAMAMPGEWHQIDEPTSPPGNKNRTSDVAECCPDGLAQECAHGCPAKNARFAPYWRAVSGL